MNIKQTAEQIFQNAGITIGGNKPFDIQVHNQDIWDRIAAGGSIALGESYMDNSWDVENLAEFVFKIQTSNTDWDDIISKGLLLHWLRAKLMNLQIGKRAYDVGQAHYDIGNDLYQSMLDTRMIYTAAYWKDAHNLDEAQAAKLDLICKKLNLQPGQKILDIGCGWGGFMKFAAEQYGVQCVGLSISKEQIAYGKEICKGLPISFILEDYQKYTPQEPFDHIVSIEMFEALGHKNYRTFMKKVSHWLRDDGKFLLQTITTTNNSPLADPWLDKYIFPNGMLPNKKLVEKSARGLLDIHQWHSLGPDYDQTLMAWWHNFDASHHLLDQEKYTETFYRMWKYYLHICAGGFRSGYLDVWQILLTKPNLKPSLYNIS